MDQGTDGLTKFTVHWGKTYYSSGVVEVLALDEDSAINQVAESIGDYEGNLQYDPNEDFIELDVKHSTTNVEQ